MIVLNVFCWYFSAKVSAISSSTSTKTLSPSRLLLSARCTGSSSRTQRPTDGWPLRSRGPTCFIQFLEIFLLWGNLDVWFRFFYQRMSVWRQWRVVGMLEKETLSASFWLHEIEVILRKWRIIIFLQQMSGSSDWKGQGRHNPSESLRCGPAGLLRLGQPPRAWLLERGS